MKSSRKLLLVFFLIVCFSYHVQSQSFYQERYPKTNMLSIGTGVSMIYADNGGQYRNMDFNISPAISVAYTKDLLGRFALKTTGGIQWIESGGNPNPEVMQLWAMEGGTFRFKGQAYFLDFMPTVYLFEYDSHMNRAFENVYGGLGLGIIHVQRRQAYSSDARTLDERAHATTAYIPFRAGINFRLGNLSDLALEGAIFFTFSDNLDGNRNFNRYNDHLGQALIMYKRYF